MAEPILPSLPTLNKSVREFRRVIQENVEQNKDKKKIDLKQQELVRQTLGISQKRLEQQQKAAAVAEESRNQLNDLKKTLEDQGVDVKKNANFQKLSTEI